MKTQKRVLSGACDMTVGDPVRLVLAFAFPLLIGDVFQQVYSMVDTMVVGYAIGDSAISAIGTTASLYALLISFASSMNTGFAIVITDFELRNIITVGINLLHLDLRGNFPYYRFRLRIFRWFIVINRTDIVFVRKLVST